MYGSTKRLYFTSVNGDNVSLFVCKMLEKPQGIFIGILVGMETHASGQELREYFKKDIRPEDMSALAHDVLSVVRTRTSQGAHVITLSGPLGAGKTTFVQMCAQILGVIETVTSPTFVVQKRYETTDVDFASLVHIDAYRIEDPQELAVLHFEELLQEPRTLIMIEWPERMAPLLPFERYVMTLGHLSEDVRQVTGGYTA